MITALIILFSQVCLGRQAFFLQLFFSRCFSDMVVGPELLSISLPPVPDKPPPRVLLHRGPLKKSLTVRRSSIPSDCDEAEERDKMKVKKHRRKHRSKRRHADRPNKIHRSKSVAAKPHKQRSEFPDAQPKIRRHSSSKKPHKIEERRRKRRVSTDKIKKATTKSLSGS